jgi:mono/diheme cytochrome c family protein
MKRVTCLVIFVALLVAVSHVHAQAVGDPREGFALAQQVCSECHAIRRGQVRSPTHGHRHSSSLQPPPE